MRRSPKKPLSNTTQNAKIVTLLDAEAEIAALKARVKRLEDWRSEENGEDAFSSEGQEVPKKRRGAKPKHSGGIYHDREMFVRFFEQHWPEIEPLCGPKPNVRLYRAFLESHGKPNLGQMGGVARQLLGRIEFWREFLSVPKYRARYRDDPRVLAGALAGVPDIGLWRSLKLCPPRTCTVPMNERAMRSYLKRKHPDVYERLTASTDLFHVTAWWKEYRTKDKQLKGHRAVGIIRWWKAGASTSTR